MRFKNRDGVNVTDVLREGVPEACDRAAEDFRPHGGQTSGWCGEENGRIRPKGADWCVDVKEFREVQSSKVMDGFKGEGWNPVIDGIFDRGPVGMLSGRNDVIDGENPVDDADGRALDQLEFIDGLERESKNKSVKAVNT